MLKYNYNLMLKVCNHQIFTLFTFWKNSKDVLEDEELHMDRMFKLSLIQDLVKVKHKFIRA